MTPSCSRPARIATAGIAGGGRDLRVADRAHRLVEQDEVREGPAGVDPEPHGHARPAPRRSGSSPLGVLANRRRTFPVIRGHGGVIPGLAEPSAPHRRTGREDAAAVLADHHHHVGANQRRARVGDLRIGADEVLEQRVSRAARKPLAVARTSACSGVPSAGRRDRTRRRPRRRGIRPRAERSPSTPSKTHEYCGLVARLAARGSSAPGRRPSPWCRRRRSCATAVPGPARCRPPRRWSTSTALPGAELEAGCRTAVAEPRQCVAALGIDPGDAVRPLPPRYGNPAAAGTRTHPGRRACAGPVLGMGPGDHQPVGLERRAAELVEIVVGEQVEAEPDRDRAKPISRRSSARPVRRLEQRPDVVGAQVRAAAGCVEA